MDASVLIARFIGPVMLVAGVAMFANRARMIEIFKEFTGNAGMMFMSGVMALALGIALVTFHNIWVADWRGFITLYGWLALIAGIVRMMYPDVAIRAGRAIMENSTALTVTAALNVLIGAYLAYQGFLA